MGLPLPPLLEAFGCQKFGCENNYSLAAFQKSWFSEVSWTFGEVSGNCMGQNEKKSNFVTVLARRFL